MAPAIKELSRWLDANSEYYVAPDWADVVKHSVSMILCSIGCQQGVFCPSLTSVVKDNEPQV